jgi:hypothetical protein
MAPDLQTTGAPGKPPQHTVWGQFNSGWDIQYHNVDDNRLVAYAKNSALNPRGYQEVFNNKELDLGAKAAYVAGRIGHDVLTDGTRTPYWALNHPLAITGLAGDEATAAAGLQPDYRAERKKNDHLSQEQIDEDWSRKMGYSHGAHVEGVPLGLVRKAIPAMAAAAMIQASGNHNLLNALGGGRPDGFAAVLPSEEDKRVSTNPVLEAAARYVFGRTGRLLPWEEFTQERPDVSPEDYKSYSAYQFDRGPGGIGLIKGTGRNIDGEPEFTMMGFRVPFSAGTATGGAMVGAIAGAQQLQDLIPQTMPGMKSIGHRRLAGAALGALAGAISGKLGGQAVNDLVIQPTMNPEAVAREQQWLAQQQALGLL